MAKTRRKKINTKPIKLYPGPNVQAVRIAAATKFNKRRARKEITFTGVNTGKAYPYSSKRRGGVGRPATSDIAITPRIVVGAFTPAPQS